MQVHGLVSDTVLASVIGQDEVVTTPAPAHELSDWLRGRGQCHGARESRCIESGSEFIPNNSGTLEGVASQHTFVVHTEKT